MTPFNPMQMIQMLRGNSNPMQMLMGMSQQNPMLGQILQMANGKTPNQLRDMTYNIAQQRGINLEQMAQQMGVTLPR